MMYDFSDAGIAEIVERFRLNDVCVAEYVALDEEARAEYVAELLEIEEDFGYVEYGV